jgi:hypothetical protein
MGEHVLGNWLMLATLLICSTYESHLTKPVVTNSEENISRPSQEKILIVKTAIKRQEHVENCV